MKILNCQLSLNIVFCLSILWSCGESEQDLINVERAKKDAELVSKYGCDSYEDCLSKFDFEGARAFSALYGADEFNIVKAESQYWLRQKDYKRSLSVIDEYQTDEQFSEFDKLQAELRYNTVSAIIDDYIEERNFIKAKEYALKLDDTESKEGYNRSEYGQHNDEKLSPFSSQQDDMLRKIEKAEKLLSK